MIFEVNDLLIRDIAFKAIDALAADSKDQRETKTNDNQFSTLIGALVPLVLKWLDTQSDGKVAKFFVKKIVPAMHIEDEDDPENDENKDNNNTESKTTTGEGIDKKEPES